MHYGGFSNTSVGLAIDAGVDLFDALAAQRLVRVGEAGMRRAEEQHALAVTKFSTGTATRSDTLRSFSNSVGAGRYSTIVDVLTSQEALARAEVNAVTARFDHLRARARIEALIGRPL